MAVEFNHTLVDSRDNWAAARSVAEILGLEEPSSYGPFAVVTLANGASLDFHRADPAQPVQQQHYAFLVSEGEFDEILGRITARGYTYWADPFRHRPGKWNTDDGGRGLYWEGPDGHILEIITRPYGSGD